MDTQRKLHLPLETFDTDAEASNEGDSVDNVARLRAIKNLMECGETMGLVNDVDSELEIENVIDELEVYIVMKVSPQKSVLVMERVVQTKAECDCCASLY
ncbi:hypothetical protein SARC_02688 [Sphaeroforma arctica JP610]|uniref:Uncharacterized protein n=1 Tax=Sphaeroforma arctica JP610 TaxID=667725 RepID=A0A0L0GA70_9EUKA|nr:hypothetical protein SARC_02688 [Sphaeroforma arctica JP610]KNC85133.1 hypothetical protein SARC_02688 [Sphaeroforma arctica JP610]|eukprot:XP_014159035.1 hypothetical protein SARC_02688 [Sphaeroforma arctica JP610]